jgi:hypothetical protein
MPGPADAGTSVRFGRILGGVFHALGIRAQSAANRGRTFRYGSGEHCRGHRRNGPETTVAPGLTQTHRACSCERSERRPTGNGCSKLSCRSRSACRDHWRLDQFGVGNQVRANDCRSPHRNRWSHGVQRHAGSGLGRSGFPLERPISPGRASARLACGQRRPARSCPARGRQPYTEN